MNLNVDSKDVKTSAILPFITLTGSDAAGRSIASMPGKLKKR
jgi:hypothetical protein